MSNYVYNRVICNQYVKEKLEDDTWCLNQKEHRIFIKYDYITKKLDNNRFELKFDTIGIDYKEKEIKELISEYKDTKWYCIEENMMEEGFYYYDGDEVQLDIRKIEINESKMLLSDVFYDMQWHWPYYRLCFFNRTKDNALIDDYDLNKRFLFTVSENDRKKVEQLVKQYVSLTILNPCYFPSNNKRKQEELTLWDGSDWGIIESHVVGDYYNKEFINVSNIALDIKNKINAILKNNKIPSKYNIKINYYIPKDNKRDYLERLIAFHVGSQKVTDILNRIDRSDTFQLDKFISYLEKNADLKNLKSIMKMIEICSQTMDK